MVLQAQENIKAYIEDMCKAEGNELLATNYEESGKDIEGCCSYIMREARNFLNGVSGMIHHDTVYGWAVHYFVEQIYKKAKKKEEAKPEPTPKAEPKAKAEPKPKAKKMQPVAQPVAEAKPEPHPAQQQNLLFDFNEL